MSLQDRQAKIKAKRAATPWKQFVMEMASRYPFAFYKNQGLISKYHPDAQRVTKIMASKDYEIHRNDSYNNSPDLSENSFFEKFAQLLYSQPHEALKQFVGSENADYVDIAFAAKNAYLSSCVLESENVAYFFQVKNGSADVYNSMLIFDHCSNIFSSRSVVRSYNIFYSSTIQNSNNLRFCVNMINCSECLLCDGLENQTYCIQNKQFTKEDYLAQKVKLLTAKDRFAQVHEQILSKVGMNTGENIIGQSNILCADVEQGYYNYSVKDGRNICLSGDGTLMENIVDAFSTGSGTCHDLCAVMGVGYNANHIYCCIETAVNVSNCYYCYYLESCSYCLGCVGLKNKSYCIFNIQYDKEERHRKVDEIFSEMSLPLEKGGRGDLWDFFPATMNPFYFNDSLAYLMSSDWDQSELVDKGYLWREGQIATDIPATTKLVQSSDLTQFESCSTDGVWSIDPNVMDYVIQDAQGNVYKIIKMEYDFLVKYGLPLPRLHWMERMKQHMKIG